ncbi:MAG TPA: hypothetical protein VGP99_09720 [Tepidisphaeraceae bacterium]|jgi:hypothetical protein|nr:hypothetical protein [Tepidisphaeraceae bacterium]
MKVRVENWVIDLNAIASAERGENSLNMNLIGGAKCNLTGEAARIVWEKLSAASMGVEVPAK